MSLHLYFIFYTLVIHFENLRAWRLHNFEKKTIRGTNMLLVLLTFSASMFHYANDYDCITRLRLYYEARSDYAWFLKMLSVLSKNDNSCMYTSILNHICQLCLGFPYKSENRIYRWEVRMVYCILYSLAMYNNFNTFM